jgi:hypothetical protein
VAAPKNKYMANGPINPELNKFLIYNIEKQRFNLL